MSTDLGPFRQIFFEETEEQLAALRALLDGLNERAPRADECAELFRLAHAIKGSSATFGFVAMGALAGELEQVFDAVRGGGLAWRAAMRAPCMAACQALEALMQAEQRGESPGVPDPAPGAALAGLLRAGEDRELVFRLARVVAGSEMLTASLLDELGRLGELEVRMRPGPGAEAGVWRLWMRGVRDLEAMRTALELASEPGTLDIRALPAAAAKPSSTSAPGPLPDAAGCVFRDPDDEVLSSTAQAAAPYREDAEDGSYSLFEAFPLLAVGEGRAPGAADPPAVCAQAGQEAEAGGNQGDAGDQGNAGKEVGGGLEAARDEGGCCELSMPQRMQLGPLLAEFARLRAGLRDDVQAPDSAQGRASATTLDELDALCRRLQALLQPMHSRPLAGLFEQLAVEAREVAQRSGRMLQPVFDAAGLALSCDIEALLGQPLRAWVRATVDEAYDSADERRHRGKPAQLRLALRAADQGSHLLIEIEDDGAGVPRSRMPAGLLGSGQVVDDALDGKGGWRMCCRPLSAAQSVGAEGVRSDTQGLERAWEALCGALGELGGFVDFHSTPGHGRSVGLRVPLLEQLLDGLPVAAGERCYVIPLASVVEALNPERLERAADAGRGERLQLGGESLPLIDLARPAGTPAVALLVQAGAARAVVLGEGLHEPQQVVIGRLEAEVHGFPGFCAATMLGRGRSAWILDLPALIARGEMPGAEAPVFMPSQPGQLAVVDPLDQLGAQVARLAVNAAAWALRAEAPVEKLATLAADLRALARLSQQAAGPARHAALTPEALLRQGVGLVDQAASALEVLQADPDAAPGGEGALPARAEAVVAASRRLAKLAGRLAGPAGRDGRLAPQPRVGGKALAGRVLKDEWEDF